MSASRMRVSKILGTLSEVDARDFLCDLANLHDGDLKGLDDLRKTFPEMFHAATGNEVVFKCARELRRAWDAAVPRDRDWYIFTLRQAHWQRDAKMSPIIPSSEYSPTFFENWLSGPPQVTPFEAALWYFQAKVADKAKRCARAECSRYFISPKRMGKFCSEKCAAIANRENKRRWAAESRGKGAI